jgi:hypothetical protein
MPGTSDYTTEEVLDPVWIEKDTSIKETRKPIPQPGRTLGTSYASDASDIKPSITIVEETRVGAQEPTGKSR